MKSLRPVLGWYPGPGGSGLGAGSGERLLGSMISLVVEIQGREYIVN